MTVDTSEIRKLIAEAYPQIRELRRDLHRHPEIKFEEKRTAAVVAEQLKRLGIPCRTKVGRTGVVGLLKGKRPGPCVALRADMDALPLGEENRISYRSVNPGAMHACGHDGHTANLVGVARVLSRLTRRLAGSVKFIFQPAEEAGDQGGAELMVRDGALENPRPSVLFALHAATMHPLGTVACRPGPAMASADFFDIRLFGKGAHAASPHRGIDPIVISASVLQALQTIASRRIDPLQPVVVTVGSIAGGAARNIIPDRVLLQGTVRAYDEQVRRKAAKLVQTIPGAIARAMGGRAEVDFMRCYPSVVNDARAAESVRDVVEETLGKKHFAKAEPSMGGEDFAFYLRIVPGAFFWLGNGRPGRELHQPTFDFNDEALKIGMLVMTALVMKRLGTE